MESLDRMLQRSDELTEAVLSLLEEAEFDGSERGQACFGMCNVSLEHALGLRVLLANGVPTSAIGLMRLQFEALTRAMWLLWAASDIAVSKLQAPLTTEAEKAANKLPMVSEMLEQISKKAPAGASQMLAHFKEVSWSAMNSFVHGGIHPLRRHMEGYPIQLLRQILQNSNGLTTMTGMVLAILTGDASITKPMSQIQPRFKDCLPPLQQ